MWRHRFLKPDAKEPRMLVGHAPLGFQSLGAVYRVGFGQYFRDVRLARGLTQRELANLTDVTISAISSIEVGRSFPPPARCVVLADALGVDLAEFGKEVLKWSNPWIFAMMHLRDARKAVAEINAMLGLPTSKARRRRRKGRAPAKEARTPWPPFHPPASSVP
ncbi:MULTISPECIES: helix-turn-helix domain-containing protein [Roseomonadaceae]|uniref:Helix-turn-helix transcriptional regulator n=1 Tax=Falsiroseomonas oleicola TaxID=2801474 RepID=A0ABS6H7W4_9PROT|nr:helix-turn-helix transcriptional regulator [Roseomonas oleicola]